MGRTAQDEMSLPIFQMMTDWRCALIALGYDPATGLRIREPYVASGQCMFTPIATFYELLLNGPDCQYGAHNTQGLLDYFSSSVVRIMAATKEGSDLRPQLGIGLGVLIVFIISVCKPLAVGLLTSDMYNDPAVVDLLYRYRKHLTVTEAVHKIEDCWVGYYIEAMSALFPACNAAFKDEDNKSNKHGE